VRREVIDQLLLTLGQEPVRLRPDRDHDSAEDVVLRVAGPVAGREHRLVRSVSTVGAVLEEQLVEPGQHRHHTDAGHGLGVDARNAEAPARQVDVVAVEPAELLDARTAEHERAEHGAARDVIAVSRSRLAVPELAAPDVADEHVGDAELPGECRGGLVGAADVADLLPVQAAMVVLQQLCGVEHGQDLVRVQERPLGLALGKQCGLDVGNLTDVPSGPGLLEDARDGLAGLAAPHRPLILRAPRPHPACAVACDPDVYAERDALWHLEAGFWSSRARAASAAYSAGERPTTSRKSRMKWAWS